MKKLRDYGFKLGLLSTGSKNSISDVAGVRVGHATKIEGDHIRTGVTILDPGTANLFRNKIPAAIAIGNGYGKVAGISQIQELGTLEAPIALTNTLAVGTVQRAMVETTIKNTSDWQHMDSVNIVVGDINDGRVNDMTINSVGKAEVEKAFASLSDNVETGNVGGGTGARAFSWKGGIGTASRVIIIENKTYTVGALVQTNFGGSLTMMGIPIGEVLQKNDFNFIPSTPDGSCMIVLATDAPLTSRQLERIAKRSFLGLGRTGAILAHASGDYTIAFSTSRNGVEGPSMKETIAEENINPFFLAAIESTEEAVYDALFSAETMSGNGRTLEALPKEQVIEILNKRLYG
jgi:D-aminopeptidase